MEVSVEPLSVGSVRIEFRGAAGSGKTYLRRHVENRFRVIGKIVESRPIVEGPGYDRLIVASMPLTLTLDDVKDVIRQVAEEKGSNVTFS